MDGWNHISWMWKNISIFYITVPTSIKMFKFASKNANQFYSYVSNFNSLCYDIEPRVNKEKEKISFNLLKDMLTLFTTVQSFSYAKDIKEKHKIKSNKSKSSSLWKEINNSLPAKIWIIECFIKASCSLRQWL